MNYIKSVGFLLVGIIKRIYWLLPTLLVDPFDLFNRWFDLNYNPPTWSIWLLTALGIFLAISLTYHELRMNIIKLEPPINWIDAFKKKKGVFPTIPDFLLPIVQNYSPGAPISKNIRLVTPSGQFWNRLIPSQQDQLCELVDWLGISRRDYLANISLMLPKS